MSTKNEIGQSTNIIGNEADFGYYAYFSESVDANDFKMRVQKTIHELGFPDYVFMRMSDADINPREINTITPALTECYYEQRLQDYDILLQQLCHKTKPIYQSTVREYVVNAPFDLDYSNGMQEIYRISKSFGYYDYYNVPIVSSTGDCNVVLSVTEKGCPPVKLKRNIQGLESTLRLICEAIDYVSVTKYPDIFVGNKSDFRINSKPLQVLYELANSDLTINQIADKLCISRITANHHLKTVRNEFGVNTNNAAIKKAIKSKLIHYD